MKEEVNVIGTKLGKTTGKSQAENWKIKRPCRKYPAKSILCEHTHPVVSKNTDLHEGCSHIHFDSLTRI